MEFCIVRVTLIMMSIQVTMSYNVTLSPEYITADIGTDSVNFTCTIDLAAYEAISEHWIIWWKGGDRVAHNDTVLLNSGKYSVHGVSSAQIIYYTQNLQVHGIEETDRDTYTCILVFDPVDGILPDGSSYASLLIRNFIPLPICSNMSIESETGQQQVTLICTSSLSDPPITLHWIDNEGTFLTSEPQMPYQLISLKYTISESEPSNQPFTCRATGTGSTDGKECVIGNLAPTSEMTTSIFERNRITTGRSTAVSTQTTHKTTSLSLTTMKIISDTIQPTVTEQNRTTLVNAQTATSLPHDKDTTSVLATQAMFGSSGDDNTTTIIIVSVLAGVILMIVFIVMLLRKYLKKNKNEDIHLKNCTNGTWIHTANSSNENEHEEGQTDIHNESQDRRLITIEFGDGEVDGQSSEYKNSAFETDTDDPDPFYAAVGQTNVEESQEHNMATNDDQKTSGIYPIEDDSEYMSTEDMEFKKAPVPAMKPEKPNKFKVKNYPAPNGDMYAQVDKFSKSISDRISTLLRNEEEMSLRRKKSEEKNDKLVVDKKKEIMGNPRNSSRYIFTDIDNDDPYVTVPEIVQNIDDQDRKEFPTAEVRDVDEKEDKQGDNVSRTSVGSSGSIHYEVDSNAVYTKISKPRKSTIA